MEKPEGGGEKEGDRQTHRGSTASSSSSSSAFWLQDIQLKHTHHLKAPPAPQCGDPDRSRSPSLNSSPSLSPRVFLTRAPPRPLSKLHWLLWYRTVFLAASLSLSFLSLALSPSLFPFPQYCKRAESASRDLLTVREKRQGGLRGSEGGTRGGRRGRKRRYSERETVIFLSSLLFLLASGSVWSNLNTVIYLLPVTEVFQNLVESFQFSFFSETAAPCADRLDIEPLSSSANLSWTTGFFFLGFFFEMHKCFNRKILQLLKLTRARKQYASHSFPKWRLQTRGTPETLRLPTQEKQQMHHLRSWKRKMFDNFFLKNDLNYWSNIKTAGNPIINCWKRNNSTFLGTVHFQESKEKISNVCVLVCWVWSCGWLA